MKEIRGLRIDFSCHPNEPNVTGLLQCWDNGANSVSLDSREARQLGGIARDSAIDRGITTCQNQAFTLWKQTLLAIKERYPFKDDLMPEKKKWTHMEEGIHYLSEYAWWKCYTAPLSFLMNQPINCQQGPEYLSVVPAVVNRPQTKGSQRPECRVIESHFFMKFGQGR